MYSRNFGTFENISPSKLNSALQNGSVSRKSGNIPIKTYPDNSAYERFNNLGNDKKEIIVNDDIHDNTKQDNQEVLPEIVDTSISEQVENVSDVVKNVNVDKEHTDSGDKKTRSLLSELQKLTSLIDGDYFLIILAIALLFISGNDTNDKITPIALLAIILL